MSEAQSPNKEAIREAVQERVQVLQPEPQPPARTFSFDHAAEMLAAPQPTKWLIRGYLEADTLVGLFGSSGCMKSFLALDMVLCIASGIPWHGISVPDPGPVFYIAGEGFRGLAARIMAWAVAHQVDARRVPLFVSKTPALFLNPESEGAVSDAIAELAERHGKPKLVVIDTLVRCFGGDENSTEDMSAFVAALDRLRERFACAVQVIHHSGLQDEKRARGASAFRAALDMEFRLDVREEMRVLTCTKSKDHPESPTIYFSVSTQSTGWEDPETGQAICSIVLCRGEGGPGKAKTLKGANRIAYEALIAVAGENGQAHINDWRAEAYTRGISTSTEAEAKKKAFKRAVSSLLDSGHVDTAHDFYWSAEGQGGQQGDKSRLSGGDRGGQRGHPSLEGVPCPLPLSLPLSEEAEEAQRGGEA